VTDGQYEPKGDHAANQIASDHDPLAIEAIQQNSRERACQDGGNSAREHESSDYCSAVRFLDCET
jgi:hypothetical protein